MLLLLLSHTIVLLPTTTRPLKSTLRAIEGEPMLETSRLVVGVNPAVMGIAI
jgi:hypothetical protein